MLSGLNTLSSWSKGTWWIREFGPGWVPSPLRFTASYVGEPKVYMIETAAKLALEVALEFHGDKNS
jgi:hypothetical protein